MLMWNLAALLQFLSFMPLWKLNFPLNAKYFLMYLKYIAFMEFIPTEYIQNWISDYLSIDKKSPSNLIKNLG